ncbi:MAG: hypothetical protein BWY21_00378 [Parcubacteria group bacterium ADurb.Bin216]|nr:MAG: hypothetical protein BWY21_00378 [Parcubacteria group bacterium ADurb.Bin216]
MRRGWETSLREVIEKGMRYCFPVYWPDGSTRYPEMDMSEFDGSEGSMGFWEHIRGLVEDEIRKGYMHGYSKGVVDCLEDVGATDFQFDGDMSKIGAERGWREYDKNNE